MCDNIIYIYQGSQYRTGGCIGLATGTIYFRYRSIPVYRFGFTVILYITHTKGKTVNDIFSTTRIMSTKLTFRATLPFQILSTCRKERKKPNTFFILVFPSLVPRLFYSFIYFFHCCTPEASCLPTYHSYFQVLTHHSFTRYLFTTKHYLFLFQINFVFTLRFLFHFFPISYRSISLSLSLSLSLSQYHMIHTSLTLLALVQSIFFFTSNRFPVHESLMPLLTTNRYFVVIGVINRRQRDIEV